MYFTSNFDNTLVYSKSKKNLSYVDICIVKVLPGRYSHSSMILVPKSDAMSGTNGQTDMFLTQPVLHKRVIMQKSPEQLSLNSVP